MAQDDEWGCWIVGIVLLAGGWWAYEHYEIREREPEPEAIAAPLRPFRPTGLIEIGELDGGTIWRLDADSVTGPRAARQAWVIANHAKNSGVVARESKILYRINCDTTAYRTLSSVDYDKDGKVIGSWGEETFGDKDDYPPPQSYIAHVVDEACDEAFDDDAPTASALPPPPINVSIPPPAAD